MGAGRLHVRFRCIDLRSPPWSALLLFWYLDVVKIIRKGQRGVYSTPLHLAALAIVYMLA